MPLVEVLSTQPDQELGDLLDVGRHRRERARGVRLLEHRVESVERGEMPAGIARLALLGPA